jgi:hypothetical protein
MTLLLACQSVSGCHVLLKLANDPVLGSLES